MITRFTIAMLVAMAGAAPTSAFAMSPALMATFVAPAPGTISEITHANLHPQIRPMHGTYQLQNDQPYLLTDGECDTASPSCQIWWSRGWIDVVFYSGGGCPSCGAAWVCCNGYNPDSDHGGNGGCGVTVDWSGLINDGADPYQSPGYLSMGDNVTVTCASTSRSHGWRLDIDHTGNVWTEIW